eukprot:scaffold1202_cov110-Isochrysis_galbana.AAC.3
MEVRGSVLPPTAIDGSLRNSHAHARARAHTYTHTHTSHRWGESPSMTLALLQSFPSSRPHPHSQDDTVYRHSTTQQHAPQYSI